MNRPSEGVQWIVPLTTSDRQDRSAKIIALLYIAADLLSPFPQSWNQPSSGSEDTAFLPPCGFHQNNQRNAHHGYQDSTVSGPDFLCENKTQRNSSCLLRDISASLCLGCVTAAKGSGATSSKVIGVLTKSAFQRLAMCAVWRLRAANRAGSFAALRTQHKCAGCSGSLQRRAPQVGRRQPLCEPPSPRFQPHLIEMHLPNERGTDDTRRCSTCR